MTRVSLISLGILVLLNACSTVSDADHDRAIRPESLLDVSVEQVTVPLDHIQDVDDLVAWLDQSQPSHATLQCASGKDMVCINAKRVLGDFAVPVSEEMSASGSQVVLIYEQLMARDCNQRFSSYPHNPYNLNYESFGCASSGNIIQMVSDKRQFINPALLGYMDGSEAGVIYQDYGSTQSLIDKYGSGSVISDVTVE